MIKLNDQQESAYKNILSFLTESSDKLYLLYGPAGTGKTTLVTEIFKNKIFNKKKIALCATTNKAVSVIMKMYDVLNKNVHFSTIHKLLKIKRIINNDGIENFICSIDDSPSSKKKSIYFYDIIVIDESSMISNELVKQLKNISSKIKGKIIFVGDSYQLPPVNEEFSNIFHSEIESFQLSKIERSKNNIVKYSNLLRDHIENNTKIKYKSILGNGVDLIRDYDLWLNRYIESFNEDKKSIILAYTNYKCDYINKCVRKLLFNNVKNEKYLPNELIVFNNFYSNESSKYYSSQHCVIKTINTGTYKIQEFPYDCLFNLKINMQKSNDFNIIPINKEKKEHNELLCPICYEYDQEFGETPCGHAFCMDCIKVWLQKNRSCPYCRMIIVGDEIKIKDHKELSDLINNFKTKVNNMMYKTYEITSLESEKNDDTIMVIHESETSKFKKDCNILNDILINIKNILNKNKNDRLINIILKRLWEFYYYQILDKFADISYGYCITVHKSQGSTYNNVYVDLMNIVKTNYNKNQSIKCLYTAVTRASKNIKLLMSK